MITVKFWITGLSPILMNNPASMSRASGVGIKKIPTPEEEAESKAYRLNGAKSQLYIPTIAFRSSIIGRGGGASGRRIGKFTANSRVAAGVACIGTKTPIVHPKTKKPVKTYEIDTRRAVVQGNGVLRSRAMIKDWACEVEFELDDDFVTPDQLLELLNISGRVAGVLDFRPQCKGWFGKYKAELAN